eukprot:CAMPEP_0119490270 /NCGR_PEP_ID=MMETSP1344-20130328/15493_1 /TAXON_ID=236787 /ORGANISM="Florenciella parvula, Strain CCMP2471" /LENGTH=55 /DNA_ID=CAMNT_0007525399 /DNA_START=1 /DNA_END=165 /DNA_ORIENTATION=-
MRRRPLPSGGRLEQGRDLGKVPSNSNCNGSGVPGLARLEEPQLGPPCTEGPTAAA